MKKMVSMLVIVAMIFVFAACGTQTPSTLSDEAPADEAPVDSIVVKYNVTFGATGVQADGAHALGEFIEYYSEGRLVFEFYPSSQLGDASSTFEALSRGTIEMTESSTTALSGFNPMWSVFALPYLWDSGEQAINSIMDPAVQAKLTADAESHGFVIIGWYNIGSRSVMNTRRLTTNPDELSGLMVRVIEDPILAASMNAMGAIAAPMPMGEVFTALQQGTIDGVEHSPSALYDFSFHEVANYLTLTEHFTIPGVVFVSKVWFDGLSPENQEAIMQAGASWTEKWNNEIWPQADYNGMAALAAQGVQIAEIDKTPFIEATQSVRDDFLTDATPDQIALFELLMEARERN